MKEKKIKDEDLEVFTVSETDSAQNYTHPQVVDLKCHLLGAPQTTEVSFLLVLGWSSWRPCYRQIPAAHSAMAGAFPDKSEIHRAHLTLPQNRDQY